jgi:hypothetical protein
MERGTDTSRPNRKPERFPGLPKHGLPKHALRIGANAIMRSSEEGEVVKFHNGNVPINH